MLRSTSDIERAVARANLMLRTHFPWLSSIDIAQLILQRIDLCYDHLVGVLVQDFIRVLQRLTMDLRKTYPYVQKDFPERIRLEGVEYRSKGDHQKLSFYDKWLESHHPSAMGVLRQERKIYGPRVIKAALGITEPPTFQHISVDIVTRLLEGDLERLGLKDTQITDMSTSSSILLDKYDFPKASRLIGYLSLRQSMAREQLVAKGASKRTMQGYERLISDARSSLSMADEHVTLPPLSVRY